MNTTFNYVVAIALSSWLCACASDSAPTCAQVAESAVARAVSDSPKRGVPAKVQEDMETNRNKLVAQSKQLCEQRGWSKSVRRCKYNAKTDLQAASCESKK